MKEKDIRDRIQTFLKNTVRHVVVPATMGIGLTLVGCGSSESDNPDSSVPTGSLTSTSTATGGVLLYAAPMTSANTGVGTGTGQPATGGETGVNTGVSTGSSSVGTNTRTNLTTGMKYMAIQPDAGASTGTGVMTAVALYAAPYTAVKTQSNTGTDTFTAAPAYAAPMPDAGIAVKYSAVMPDAGSDVSRDVAVYSAPLPDAGVTPVLRYMAVQPDAGTMVPDYMAIQPDAGRREVLGAVALYAAPLPTTSAH
ncbi:MAG TPA: hypothetical protein VF518_11605 [Polyangia bacterium]